MLRFTDAGPAALAIAELAAESTGEVLAFAHLADSYVFRQGTDDVVKLTGVAGITNLVETIRDGFFIV